MNLRQEMKKVADKTNEELSRLGVIKADILERANKGYYYLVVKGELNSTTESHLLNECGFSVLYCECTNKTSISWA